MFHIHPTLRVIPLRRAGGPASTEPRAEHSVALGVIDVATTRPDRAKAFNANIAPAAKTTNGITLLPM